MEKLFLCNIATRPNLLPWQAFGFWFLSVFWHVVVHEESKRNIPLTGSLVFPNINRWHVNETVLTERKMIEEYKCKYYTHSSCSPSSPKFHIKALQQLEQLLNKQLGMQHSLKWFKRQNACLRRLWVFVFMGWQLQLINEDQVFDSLLKYDKAMDFWLPWKQHLWSILLPMVLKHSVPASVVSCPV